MKIPCGPETRKKAANTTPRQLASLLNRVLYSADHKHVLEEGWSKINDKPVRRWVAHDVVYKGDEPIPEGMTKIEDKDKYFETEALLIAIRDFLEFKSFEEVIP
jgi:hypothetical protein